MKQIFNISQSEKKRMKELYATSNPARRQKTVEPSTKAEPSTKHKTKHYTGGTMDKERREYSSEMEFDELMREEEYHELMSQCYSAKHALIDAIRNRIVPTSPNDIVDVYGEFIHDLYWAMKLDLGDSWSSELNERFKRRISGKSTDEKGGDTK
jgi:hypothetical protein